MARRLRAVSQGSAAQRQPFAPPAPSSSDSARDGAASHVRAPGRLARTLARLARVDGRVFAALIALEVLVALVLLVPRSDVAATGAGFGDVAAALLRGDGYGMRVPCGQFDVARRLPLAPVFLAAVGLLGGGAWSAVLLRGALLASLAGLTLSRFCAARGQRCWQNPVWTALLALLACCPMFAKHLSQLSYEEGWSLVLVPCLLVAGVAVLDTSATASRSRGAWGLALGALAAALFSLKSTYLPLHLCACAALAWAALRRRSRWSGLGLLLALCAPLAWGSFVWARTGQFSVGSSWDGENLFRGFCQACALVYPSQSLDRLFDTAVLATPSGPVHAEALPGRCAFTGEWAWDAFYRQRALADAGAPGIGAYLGKKLGVLLFEVRPVPWVGNGGALRSALVLVSFVLARAALGLALVLGWRWRRALRRQPSVLVFGGAALAALAAPLLVGFAYDRHTFVLLVAAAALAAAIATVIHADPEADPQPVARAPRLD